MLGDILVCRKLSENVDGVGGWEVCIVEVGTLATVTTIKKRIMCWIQVKSVL